MCQSPRRAGYDTRQRDGRRRSDARIPPGVARWCGRADALEADRRRRIAGYRSHRDGCRVDLAGRRGSGTLHGGTWNGAGRLDSTRARRDRCRSARRRLGAAQRRGVVRDGRWDRGVRHRRAGWPVRLNGGRRRRDRDWLPTRFHRRNRTGPSDGRPDPRAVKKLSAVRYGWS